MYFRKIKTLISIILILILVTILSFKNQDNYQKQCFNDYPLFDYVIVLDAGHGGRDDGSSGVNTGVKEADLNLQITKRLEKQLKNFGFKVVLTREDKDGLYDKNVENFKKSDMVKRKEIIEKANPNMVISIHMNSFPSNYVSGAQAFYQEGDDNSKMFAESVQKQLLKNFDNAKKEANKGDYYILKCINRPTILVECGYLTNPEEELLLQKESYQEKMAYSILCGIIEYFKVAETLCAY